MPLFPPELPGHAERLKTALRDAQPSVVLTTAAVLDVVQAFLAKLTDIRIPEIIVIDEVPDSAEDAFAPIDIDADDVAHLQYTGGATRPPVGVEITHRAAGINLLQMIVTIDLRDRNTHGVSWLPLYHDMGLSMIGFPAVYRRAFHPDVADGVHPTPAALDTGAGRRVTRRPGRHRRTELRLPLVGAVRCGGDDPGVA